MNPDEPYYKWLISQIEFPVNFNESFDELLRYLHQTEFVWVVSGDDNRVQDAKDLRTDFMYKFDVPNDFPELGFADIVSVLEIIIAVSRILEFVAGGEAAAWAWRLIDNLGLNHFYDPLDLKKIKAVDEILETLIWRTYDRNGKGGFFPLLFPEEDQTKVEIWYQLNAYVNEIIQNDTS
jgi:hypothetical protein